MEVAYDTIRHRARRKDNVIDLAEYRTGMQRAQTLEPDVPEESVVTSRKEPDMWERAAHIMDLLASAALTVGALAAMCIAVFAMI